MHVYGKIVGHELKTETVGKGDEAYPVEFMAVKIEIQPLGGAGGEKPSKGVLHLETATAVRDWPIGEAVELHLNLPQGRLDLDGKGDLGSRLDNTKVTIDNGDGKPVTGTLRQVKEAVDVVKGRRGARRQRGSMLHS